jgi:hypothetical protein
LIHMYKYEKCHAHLKWIHFICFNTDTNIYWNVVISKNKKKKEKIIFIALWSVIHNQRGVVCFSTADFKILFYLLSRCEEPCSVMRMFVFVSSPKY